MTCKDVKHLLLSYLDDEVSLEERKAIEAHLSVCPSCEDELEALASTQQQLRQAYKAMLTGASPSSYVWATIKEQLVREEHRKVSILDLVKSKMKGRVETLKLRQPVWKVALASVLALALILTLCLVIPSLLSQSFEAKAKDIVMKNATVQALVAEAGFSITGLTPKVTTPEVTGWMRPEWYDRPVTPVQLVNKKDGMVVAYVIVEEETEDVIWLNVPSLGKVGYMPSEPPSPEGWDETAVEIAKADAEVQQMLDSGAEIGEVLTRIALEEEDEHRFAWVELLQVEKSWMVEVDLTERKVVRIFG